MMSSMQPVAAALALTALLLLLADPPGALAQQGTAAPRGLRQGPLPVSMPWIPVVDRPARSVPAPRSQPRAQRLPQPVADSQVEARRPGGDQATASRAAASSTKRRKVSVTCVGDSITQGIFLDEADKYPTVLRERYGFGEVLNAALYSRTMLDSTSAGAAPELVKAAIGELSYW